MSNQVLIWARLLALPLIFLAYTAMLASFVTHISSLQLHSDEVLGMTRQFKLYNEAFPMRIAMLFCLVYLYKQAFAIPGSFFMNLLAGTLYGTTKGFIFVCTMSTIGATLCYLISKCFCKPVIKLFFPRQIDSLTEKIKENEGSLFFYLLGSRIFPVSPNYLLNALSPVVGIPCHLFGVTVLLGLMPYNYFTVQAGTLLSQIDPENLSKENALNLACVAAIVTIPGFLLPRLRRYFHRSPTESHKEE
ncbi:unnamed protein product [Mesocestoides corti]|uniref:VTT domain-containing protein n=2 Tax=Mesocestoides corti TaxID=53468 RepID=A0A0R3UGC6_MESCO|nr:unnamed protein product [Mesocestoides corti]